MMHTYGGAAGFNSGLGFHPFLGGVIGAGLGLVIVLIVLWSLLWKALALWRAARQGSKWWFVILLVVNTFGILEILYIYVFSKKKMGDMMKPARPIEDKKNLEDHNQGNFPVQKPETKGYHIGPAHDKPKDQNS